MHNNQSLYKFNYFCFSDLEDDSSEEEMVAECEELDKNYSSKSDCYTERADTKLYLDDPEINAWWKVVQEAVLAIQEARPAVDGATQEDLYRCVESFITALSPRELYSRLKG